MVSLNANLVGCSQKVVHIHFFDWRIIYFYRKAAYSEGCSENSYQFFHVLSGHLNCVTSHFAFVSQNPYTKFPIFEYVMKINHSKVKLY